MAAVSQSSAVWEVGAGEMSPSRDSLSHDLPQNIWALTEPCSVPLLFSLRSEAASAGLGILSFCHFLAGQPWDNDLPLLSLRFLFHKIGPIPPFWPSGSL